MIIIEGGYLSQKDVHWLAKENEIRLNSSVTDKECEILAEGRSASNNNHPKETCLGW